MLFYIWLLGATTVLGGFAYIIGRESKRDNDEFFQFLCAAAVAFFWPIALVLLIVSGPFYALYHYGKKRTKTEADKKKMIDILKR